MERSKQSVSVRSPRCRKAQSSLVRSLLRASDDPAKQRIRRWLSGINDQQLLILASPQTILPSCGIHRKHLVRTKFRRDHFKIIQRKEGVRDQKVIVRAAVEGTLLLTGYAIYSPAVTTAKRLNGDTEVVNASRGMNGRHGKISASIAIKPDRNVRFATMNRHRHIDLSRV
jgi:hypothetical protein